MISRSSHRRSSHRSSMHSSLHRSMSRRSSLNNLHRSSLHRSSFKKHGISNAHAFAVGKATGVNINGSALGAHGAAIHRAKEMRKNSKNRSRMLNKSFASRHRSSDYLKKMSVSTKKHRYTSSKGDFEKMESTINEVSKYIWIPFLGFIVILIVLGFFMTIMFFRIFINNFGI